MVCGVCSLMHLSDLVKQFPVEYPVAGRANQCPHPRAGPGACPLSPRPAWVDGSMWARGSSARSRACLPNIGGWMLETVPVLRANEISDALWSVIEPFLPALAGRRAAVERSSVDAGGNRLAIPYRVTVARSARMLRPVAVHLGTASPLVRRRHLRADVRRGTGGSTRTRGTARTTAVDRFDRRPRPPAFGRCLTDAHTGGSVE